MHCKINVTGLLSLKTVRWSRSSNFNFRMDFFDNGICSPSHAWMLGFAFGDGSVKNTNKRNTLPETFTISLQYGDIDVLRNIKSILDLSIPISVESNGRSNNWRPQCRITITNTHFASTLVQLGCVPNKAKILSFPHSVVPNRYIGHFIRGYMESDGSIMMYSNGHHRIKFEAMCDEFINDLRNVMESRLNVSHATIAKYSTNRNLLRWSKRNDIIQILNYVYHDSHEGIRMNRKYERMKCILETIDKPMKDRVGDFKSCKRKNQETEFRTLCNLIELTCSAAANNSRMYQDLNFTNSWILFLSTFALDNDGYLLPDWKEKTWQVVRGFYRNV